MVLNGDISNNQLGLSDNIYRSISNKVECIINCAANVKHYGKYDEFYQTNVVGTKNLLKFACSEKIKDYNHISTMSVASGNIENKNNDYFTEYDYDMGQQSNNYYIKTKQEAEKVVIEARNKGINCNIFRVGNIVFNSINGKFQQNIYDNNFYKIIKSYIKLSTFPISKNKALDFSFVNYVSRAIVLLYDKKKLENEIYHIFNPNYVSIFEIGELVSKVESNIKLLKPLEFIDYLSEKYYSNSDTDYVENILFQFSSALDKNSTQFIIGSEKTNIILKREGFEWPRLNRSHIEKMIYYCKKVKYL